MFPIRIFQDLKHLFWTVTKARETDLILAILSVIDLMLIANLLIMVIISGYENFIGSLGMDEQERRPSWLKDLDPGTIKIKVASSIVAISSIHLLSVFLNIREFKEEEVWLMTGMHIAFVISSLLLAYIDRVSNK